jgi:hypothetical protein
VIWVKGKGSRQLGVESRNEKKSSANLSSRLTVDPDGDKATSKTLVAYGTDVAWWPPPESPKLLARKSLVGGKGFWGCEKFRLYPFGAKESLQSTFLIWNRIISKLLDVI